MRVRPDLIFTHHESNAHQDHRATAELTWNTFRDHLIWSTKSRSTTATWVGRTRSSGSTLLPLGRRRGPSWAGSRRR
jgi:LmbE family N-acetylglucosaminyl deacetylase